MKIIIFALVFLVYIGVAYAGWGDIGWGEQGWGDEPAVEQGGGGGGADTGSGGGGGSFQSGAESGPVTFAAQALTLNQESCEQSTAFSWYIDTCYECEGIILDDGEGLICKTCNEGFVLKGDICKKKFILKSQLNLLDKGLKRFFPDDPLFGFIVIVTAGVIGVGAFFNRKEIISKIRKR